MAKFIVTGCAGFIGSHLTDFLLDRGHEVIGVDNFLTGKRENIMSALGHSHFHFFQKDVRDIGQLDLLTQIDGVFHLAAKGSVPLSMKTPVEFAENNVGGMASVLEYVRRRGIKRCVYASSSSVYGSSTAPIKSEGEEGVPLSPYALTKKINEEQAKAYRNIYGTSTVGLRFFNVYGRRQDVQGLYAAVIPKWAASIKSGFPIPVYGDALNNSRDFTYVKDVVHACWLAMISNNPKVSGNVYNVGTGNPIKLSRIPNFLCSLFGVSDFSVDQREARAGDVSHSRAAVSKAGDHLCFFANYSIGLGLKDMFMPSVGHWTDQEIEEVKNEKAMSFME